MRVEAITSGYETWDEYVLRHPDSRGPHLSGWKKVIEETFGHRCYYLAATEGSVLRGVLPLTHMRSRIFGSFLISVPYLNYGGILADDETVRAALYAQAQELGKKLKVQYLELRHLAPQIPEAPTKQHKVAMVLELPGDTETLWNNFKAKLRSQIRKPQKEGLTARFGQSEELDNFYNVFAENMRDLGTPVYSKKFFARILATFPQQAHLCTVYHKQEALAAGFVFGFRDMLEIPWASSLRKHNALAPNMLLYWSVLEYAIKQGYRRFDFGRCSPNEGTYKFKEQWGALPAALYWQYWLSNGRSLPDLSPHNPKYQRAIELWQKVPLGITRLLGPPIVKNIP
ncbi:FemAB family PEP-CTERM system-associated protein [candidate division KSB1 bacterium]|nr:FemAB family PEP-CTERM system-associated protein [candidate division KSB1 bacterium]